MVSAILIVAPIIGFVDGTRNPEFEDERVLMRLLVMKIHCYQVEVMHCKIHS